MTSLTQEVDRGNVIRSTTPIKYPYRGDVRWAFLKWADIESSFNPGMTYLRRLRIFQTPWFALYLHFILEPDSDRDPHDHPCNFRSFIVRGGYVERLYDRVRHHDYTHRLVARRRFHSHLMPIEFAHQIVLLKPRTITLCWFGRRQRQWGFWTSEGFVPYKEYSRSDAGRAAVMDPFGG